MTGKNTENRDDKYSGSEVIKRMDEGLINSIGVNKAVLMTQITIPSCGCIILC
jgi:hypothetical protein